MRWKPRRTPPAPVAHPILRWERGGAPPIDVELRPDAVITIGRDPESVLAIDSAFVSKAHARLERDGERCVLEDLGSANGTRLNGEPVTRSTLKHGDVIDVGDQHLLFVAPDTSAGTGKALRLAVVAGATLVVTAGILVILLRSACDPAADAGSVTPAPPGADGPAAGTGERPVPGRGTIESLAAASPLVEEVVGRAERSGLDPVDALVDEGNLAYRTGRLREALHLYGAAVAREPAHAVADSRFRETAAQLEQAIADHLARGERDFTSLRFEDAVLEWEQVLLLADPSDARYATAQAGIDKARARLKR